MNKTLKFAPELIPLVLSGQKNSTWRLWDDKNLSIDDILILMNAETREQFQTAKVTRVVIKPMGQLTQSDKEGHETFSNDDEMYRTYSKYYGKEVNSDTEVKIIWFELI